MSTVPCRLLTKIATNRSHRHHCARDTEHFDLPPLFHFQIQQHDDEQEQHHDRARVNEDLNRRQEKCLQQHEQSRE